jgi:hypothetical protein
LTTLSVIVAVNKENRTMVDITLSSDRIRTAPIEVRRWIENELADLLGMRTPPLPPVHHEHLVTCSVEEVGQIFDFVQGMPPVVAVLLELGRAAGSRLPNKIVMTTLHEISTRAHLQAESQVIACLRIINETLQQIRSDQDALLCAVDDEERCYVALETQTHIREMWQAIVAAHAHAYASKPIKASCAPPYTVAPASSAQDGTPGQATEPVVAG